MAQIIFRYQRLLPACEPLTQLLLMVPGYVLWVSMKVKSAWRLERWLRG